MAPNGAQRLGRQPRPGFLFIPTSQHDQMAGTASAGGNLARGAALPGVVFVDALQASSVMLALAVQEITMGPANQSIPKLGNAMSYWFSTEATEITETDVTTASGATMSHMKLATTTKDVEISGGVRTPNATGRDDRRKGVRSRRPRHILTWRRTRSRRVPTRCRGGACAALARIAKRATTLRAGTLTSLTLGASHAKPNCCGVGTHGIRV